MGPCITCRHDNETGEYRKSQAHHSWIGKSQGNERLCDRCDDTERRESHKPESNEVFHLNVSVLARRYEPSYNLYPPGIHGPSKHVHASESLWHSTQLAAAISACRHSWQRLAPSHVRRSPQDSHCSGYPFRFDMVVFSSTVILQAPCQTVSKRNQHVIENEIGQYRKTVSILVNCGNSCHTGRHGMAYMVVCGMTIHDRLTTTTQEYNLRLMFAP